MNQTLELQFQASLPLEWIQQNIDEALEKFSKLENLRKKIFFNEKHCATY